MRRTRIAYGSHHSQAGDLWLPADPPVDVPLVVLIHGGFWRAMYTKALMSRLARAIVDRGWAAWNIEYRRLGALGGGGGWPETFEDVAAALDHVATFSGIDHGHVVTCGHSAGGTLALWAAGRHRLPPGTPGATTTTTVSAAISLAGVVNLAAASTADLGAGAVGDLLGGDEADLPERYAVTSPSALLPLGVPQLLIHGLNDTVVPPSMSERYVEQALEAGDEARYLPLAGIGHREVISPQGASWGVLSAYLADAFPV